MDSRRASPESEVQSRSHDARDARATVHRARHAMRAGESRWVGQYGPADLEARRSVLPVEAMHPGTVGLLRALSARQAADRLRAGPAYQDSGLVVVDALGTPLRPEWYSDRFRALCKAAGAPPITLHSVSHSLAFWLHRAGVAPADASALLRHTVEVHLSTYLPHSGASGIAWAAQALGRAAAAE